MRASPSFPNYATSTGLGGVRWLETQSSIKLGWTPRQQIAFLSADSEIPTCDSKITENRRVLRTRMHSATVRAVIKALDFLPLRIIR